MTDEELAARYVAARDPDDYRELMERNAAQVLRLVSSVLGPFRDIDAEEVLQEVFLKVHDKIGQFRGEASFSTWVYRTAYRTALNTMRAARFRRPHLDLEVLRNLAAADDPFRDYADAEKASAIAEALEDLPDLYRTAVYLHYWHDTAVNEIATLLGVPPNTVKSYLFRARERLSRDLEKKGIR